MKKETLIALLLGIIAGGIIALVIIFNAKEKDIKGKKVIATKKMGAIIKNKIDSQPLVVTEPENEIVSTKNTIIVKGKTGKGATLVIQSPLEEQVVRLTNNQFAQTVQLGLGENIISITSYNNKSVDEKKLKIYFFND